MSAHNDSTTPGITVLDDDSATLKIQLTPKCFRFFVSGAMANDQTILDFILDFLNDSVDKTVQSQKNQ